MAKRKIPSNMQPWKANINGKEYEYESGITAEVPDEVAALIDFIDESAPKRDPKAAQRAIEDEVTQIVKDNFVGGVGYEEPAEVVMLAEMSFEVVTVDNDTLISNSFPYTFEIGKKYTVTFDGVTNTYTAIEYNTTGALINTSLNDIMADNGWLIAGFEGVCWLITSDPSLIGTHTISISRPVTKRHGIDSKFMPINYMPIKVLNANSAGNLFTDFNPADPVNSPSVPLTYEEAFSLLKSGSPVLIFYKKGRYTVTGIRVATGNAETGFKYIYFDIMDSDSATVKSFSVENPNYSGEG